MAMTTARDAVAGQAAAGKKSQSSSARPERIGVPHLAEEAAQADVDPCDLCVEALPGYVLGDLPVTDSRWVLEHTAHCTSCRSELHCYEEVDSLLDRCCQVKDEATPPLTALFQAPVLREAAWGRVDSPIGELLVAVSGTGVCEIAFGWMENDRAFVAHLMQRGFMPIHDDNRIQDVAAQLGEYFSGRRSHFAVPLDFSGLSLFSRSVLEATASVPFGETRTYGEIARTIGKPGASRAVGNALNRNPIPLIVPCHRIVPTGDGIGKYAGGVEAKVRLLTLEGVLNRPVSLFAQS
jgi:methylated-DNA-[protein]-cysteine S-methyltransferase